MVAGEYQHVFRIVLIYELNVLIDGVGRSAVPLPGGARNVGRKHEYAAVHPVKIPRLAGAEIGVQRKGLILREHADGVDVGVDAVG